VTLREKPDHTHAASPPAPPAPSPTALPPPTGPAPEIVASWHRNPPRGPGEPTEATAQALTKSGEDMAADLFRGIRTDGCACILTVPPAPGGGPAGFKLYNNSRAVRPVTAETT